MFITDAIVVCLCSGKVIMTPWDYLGRRVVERELQKGEIEPRVELRADLFQKSDMLEAEFLMQPDDSGVYRR